MTQRAVKTNNIVMHFSTPPSADDLSAIIEEILEELPDEIKKYVGDFSVELQEFPDLDLEEELDLESPYDQLAYFKAVHVPSQNLGASSVGKGDADILYVYRRPVLDLWCESEDDLTVLIHSAIIQELGHHCGFSDDEIDDMINLI